MNAVQRYLADLDRALHTRGRARRRLLAECGDHLADAAAAHGEDDAVRRFGSAAELAASFDTETAIRRASRGTMTTIVGVVAVAASTLALLNAADSRTSAVVVWAVVFFGCAQAAGVCALSAALRTAAMRHDAATTDDVAVLCRRNVAALAFSLTTLFAAAAAVPGHAAAWVVLAGPVVAAPAAVPVLRARTLARRLGGRAQGTVRPPLDDLSAVVGRAARTARTPRTAPLLVAVVCAAGAAAFGWDHLDHGGLTSSLTAAYTEAGLVVLGFVALGSTLGLVPGRGRATT